MNLKIRKSHGKSNSEPMAAVLIDSTYDDQIDCKVTVQDLVYTFSNHLTNWNPSTDLILVELSGRVIGYIRG
jgi:hypothetical protein